VELCLYDNFEPGIGDEMLTALLTNDDLKLEKLGMPSNNITSIVSTWLADFLATNPRLKELDLNENHLNDSDAVLIANALRANRSEMVDENRDRKIYSILSSRNKTISNVQHFDDIDVKLLPNVLESVQRYSKYATRWHKHESKPLSIVYEVMRKWDKAFPLYKSGAGNIDT